MEFSPKKATTTKKYCSVPQCSSLAERERTLSFHTFPKEDETVRVSDVFGSYATTGRRKEWARVLKIGKPVSKAMYVCSKHFTADNFRFPDIPAQKRYLKYDAIPSKNLPQLPARDLSQTTTRDLDRRKKRLQENSVTSVSQCPLNDEENELCGPKLSRSTEEERLVEVKAEPADGLDPPAIVFVKTEVTDDDYGDQCQPATGLDLLTASSYSATINLGRDGAESKMDADRPDFRFVDVDQTIPAPSTRVTADVDPLELTDASLSEPTIKQEQPDYAEEYPPVAIPHCIPTGGLHEHMPTDQEIENPNSTIPQAGGRKPDEDKTHKPTVCEDSSSDSDKSTGSKRRRSVRSTGETRGRVIRSSCREKNVTCGSYTALSSDDESPSPDTYKQQGSVTGMDISSISCGCSENGSHCGRSGRCMCRKLSIPCSTSCVCSGRQWCTNRVQCR